MLRSSLPRVCGSCSSPRPSLRSTRLLRPVATSVSNHQQQKRFVSAPHAISNPTLASIEKRWEGMPPQEQANIWMQLRDRMEQDWHHLTVQEKKAGKQSGRFDRGIQLTVTLAYWIAFGNHGPRALPPPGENLRIFWYTMAGVGISFALFLTIRSFAGPPPRTMNKEWQQATDEYLKVGLPRMLVGNQ